MGLFAILSGSCAVIFFVLQYTKTWLVGTPFIGIGVILILVEIFTMIGAGFLAALSELMALVGVFGAFMPAGFSWFSDEQAVRPWRGPIDFTDVAVVVIGVVGVIILAPNYPSLKR